MRQAADQRLPRVAASQAVWACKYVHDPLFAAVVNLLHRCVILLLG